MDTREVTRKYRLNQWIEIIRECRSSGQTVSAWCADHDINPKSYYYWLKRVRTAACEALPAICAGDSPIVPINIPGNMAGVGHKGQESSVNILLHFGNATLELRNGASLVLIENTLKALQNVR